MCFSAILEQDYIKYIRVTGADISIEDFVRTFYPGMRKVKRPKAMDAWFNHPKTAAERQVADAIAQDVREQIAELEQLIFKQRARLATARRALATKPTKKAAEDERIATSKVEWALGRLADLKRTTLEPKDGRIFPGWFAPVIVVENGKRMIKPMRYQCRPAGKPAFYDTKYPGTYNARRDNLEGFWKSQFGHTHGLMLATTFYENVSRHTLERRELAPNEAEQNVVLEFAPRGQPLMLVACLWSRWTGANGEELLSFAAITDEPPPEVAATGHDRCIIPIKPENMEAWLNPDPNHLERSYAILDDRERPFYEHRMAA